MVRRRSVIHPVRQKVSLPKTKIETDNARVLMYPPAPPAFGCFGGVAGCIVTDAGGKGVLNLLVCGRLS